MQIHAGVQWVSGMLHLSVLNANLKASAKMDSLKLDAAVFDLHSNKDHKQVWGSAVCLLQENRVTPRAALQCTHDMRHGIRSEQLTAAASKSELQQAALHIHEAFGLLTTSSSSLHFQLSRTGPSRNVGCYR